MATRVGETSAVSRAMMEEEVKKIVLNHFHAVYVDRDISSSMEHISQKIRWIGSKDFYIAHSKEEFRQMLERELGSLPGRCAIEVMAAEGVMLTEDCFTVSGEFDIRIPHPLQLVYQRMRFTAMLVLENGEYMVVSLQTSISSDDKIKYETKTMNGDSMKMLADDLRRQNQYDPVTGLYTLEAFKQVVEDVLKKEPDSRFVMLCTDVTHYEQVNNLYGLKRADKMLSDLSVLLTTFSQNVRVSCRSIADHFLVLMTYMDRELLEEELRKLCSEFRNTISEEYIEAAPRLGVGAYAITNLNEDIDSIVERTNMTRKALKLNHGIEVVFYDARIFKRIEKMNEIESSMQGALENGEFKVFIQPKYSLTDNQIVGAEALCRWIHDDGSMVYPDEFIPVFEEDGFIAELDFYMLEQVCRMLKRREEEGRKCVAVSINQSRVLLQDTQYVSKIAAILKRYEIPSEYIELELTERIFQDDLTGFARMMGELKKHGIRWSIDDFGTGYSSLNLLKELPVDILKIDKSFLDETETSEMSKIIIRKTVELAQELDKYVVCEGVETESQADYLRNIRCDMAQGYLYSQPLPMQDFEQLLDEEMAV